MGTHRTGDPEALRARMVQEIPRGYSPWLHLAGTTGIGTALLVLGALFVEDPMPLELLVIPAVFVVANGFEWRAHKYVLHRRFWPFGVLYDRHTPVHHQVYQYGDMAIRSARELRLVLIPASGVLGVVLAAAPFAQLVGWLVTPNAGWLTLVTAGLYMVGYELTHLAYHLPPQSFIGRRGLIRRLREHHARHHHPALMQKWNFNVTIPLWDWVLGTLAPRELLDRVAGEPRGPEAPATRSPR